MDTAVPIQITADIPAMRLILLGLLGLGILFIVTMTLKTFTGRTHRGQASGDAGPHASRPWSSVLVPAIFGVGLLIAGVILVGVLTLAPMRVQESYPTAHLSETTAASFVDRVESVDVTRRQPSLRKWVTILKLATMSLSKGRTGQRGKKPSSARGKSQAFCSSRRVGCTHRKKKQWQKR